MIGLLAVGGLIALIALAYHFESASPTTVPTLQGAPAATQTQALAQAAQFGAQLGQQYNANKAATVAAWGQVAASVGGVVSSVAPEVAPIVTGIQSLLKVFTSLRSTTHIAASLWVSQVQDPFANDKHSGAVNLIVDGKDASIANGTATAASVQQARNATFNLWQQYQAAAAGYSSQGKAEQIVISQSFQTLNPLMNQILSDMDAQILRLP